MKTKGRRCDYRHVSAGEPEYPCIACAGEVTNRQQGLECDSFMRWQHRTCGTGITQAEYRAASQQNRGVSWRCNECAPSATRKKRALSIRQPTTSLWDAAAAAPAVALVAAPAATPRSMSPIEGPVADSSHLSLLQESPQAALRDIPSTPDSGGASPGSSALFGSNNGGDVSQLRSQARDGFLAESSGHEADISMPSAESEQGHNLYVGHDEVDNRLESHGEEAADISNQPPGNSTIEAAQEHYTNVGRNEVFPLEESVIAEATPNSFEEPQGNVVAYKIVPESSLRRCPKLVDHRGYSYTKKRSNQTTTHWRCTKRSPPTSCKAGVCQNGDTFISKEHEHNHPPVVNDDIIMEMRANAKDEAEQRPFDSAAEIAERAITEALEQNALPLPSLPSVENLARALNRAREKKRPKQPRELDFDQI